MWRLLGPCTPTLQFTYTCAQPLCVHVRQHELSHKGSEADGHRRKRQAISKAEIQQRLSTFYGRPLDEADMSKILPEFAQGEFSLNADGARGLHLLSVHMHSHP